MGRFAGVDKGGHMDRGLEVRYVKVTQVRGARKILRVIICFGFGLIFTVHPASAEEMGVEDNLSGRYKSIIYGVVEKAPLGNVGYWVINKRDVAVTKETRFIEKHGKAVVGAYVEVEGENTAMSFAASKIEVKRSKPR
jgi:hypothetical protein